MAYVRPNVRSKKDLIQVIKEDRITEVFQPGLGTIPTDGTVHLEGPHYPEPHKWYATGTMKNGKLVSVK